jgi:uncharacterized membrane protein YidH (DUF202 family)
MGSIDDPCWRTTVGIFLRVAGVGLVALAGFLVAAVIHAVASTSGARAGVAVGYIAGAIVLVAAAVWFWRIAARRQRSPNDVEPPA